MGWSLEGLSVIVRCARTVVQDGVKGAISYDANDRFCLDGQRLVVSNGGAYGADGTEYGTERESFSKVVSHGQAGSGPEWFEVRTKSGEILEYGSSADSRIEAQGGEVVRLWAQKRLCDARGNSFGVPSAPIIPKEQWICVEFMLKHNTPGERDGEQAFWIDGKLQGHWTGINWRKSPTLKANALTLESYITDSWTKNPVNVVSFDNLVIAKSYIGPVK